MRPRLRAQVGLVVALAALGLVFALGGSQRGADQTAVQSVADLSQFDPANIVSNEVFFSRYSMSTAEVQQFLDRKNPSCVAGADGTPCLKDYRQDTSDRTADTFCSAYPAGSQETAAVIITKVAAACGINPRVLLVVLQKEQGLVTGSGGGLDSTRYQKAMGFGCPDTAACDTKYYGFQNQVYNAARQYQRYAGAAAGSYRAGKTYDFGYAPATSSYDNIGNARCGTQSVTIANTATAGLYNYTPYVPNAAALGAGYGKGDSCSAYGNRNFWLYFTDWFGSTQSDAVAKASPTGTGDTFALTSSGFSATGWAFDPDAPSSPVTVRATVDGRVVSTVTANQSRPDVGTAYGVGSSHGFSLTGLLSYGSHQVCLLADNLAGQGAQVQLSCKIVNFTDTAPRLTIDTLQERADGSVLLSGWAWDAEGRAPQVHVYDNGSGRAYGTNITRPDVQAAFPAAGPNAGFSVTVGPLSGSHEICVFAVDMIATGNNRLVICQTFSYKAPIGSVDEVSETVTGEIRVRGWTLDPSVPASPVQAHVYVDSKGVVALDATGGRDDIARNFPGAGPAHGFDTTIPLSPGTHQVCVFGINNGLAGTNPVIACRNITVQYVAPQGTVDRVTAIGDGQVRVVGWGLDRSIPSTPVTVHHYVDGRYVSEAPATGSRPDIAAAFPGAGAAHGFDAVLTVGTGRHDVCTFLINVGVAGHNVLLNCTTLVGYDTAAQGALDGVSPAGSGQATVRGWAFDPDVPTRPSSVQVTVDGVDSGVFTADASRPDVGRVYPAAGPAHGFSVSVAVGPGTHRVCVLAISTGNLVAPRPVGCAQVTQ